MRNQHDAPPSEGHAEAVRVWNDKHAVGTRVSVRVGTRLVVGETDSRAFLSGATGLAVIFVKPKPGLTSLLDVASLEEAGPELG